MGAKIGSALAGGPEKPVEFLFWNLAPTIAGQAAATLVLIVEPERDLRTARVDLQSGMIMVIFYLI